MNRWLSPARILPVTAEAENCSKFRRYPLRIAQRLEFQRWRGRNDVFFHAQID
jgi:hypothetical protein